MNVLAVGVGADELAKQLFEGAEVEHAITRIPVGRKEYDAILLLHVLQRVSYREWLPAVQKYVARLKTGGDLHVFVPSLEWAAEQILDEGNTSPLLHQHLYGEQTSEDAFNLSGFTMANLRALLDRAGLAVTHARSGIYAVGAEGNEYQAEMHFAKAVKK